MGGHCAVAKCSFHEDESCHIDERLLDRRRRPSLHKLRRMPKIAIIAAIERELWPLIKNWRSVKAEHEDREFTFYESDYAVAVCGGMGAEYGRRAAEAVIMKYSPEIMISAGVAGALVPELRVGDTVFPAVVIDARDGSRHESAWRA